MERLVDRARAAMNLILIVSLWALWAVINNGPDITNLAERIKIDSEAVRAQTEINNRFHPDPGPFNSSLSPQVETFLDTVHDGGPGTTKMSTALEMISSVRFHLNPDRLGVAIYSTQPFWPRIGEPGHNDTAPITSFHVEGAEDSLIPYDDLLQGRVPEWVPDTVREEILSPEFVSRMTLDLKKHYLAKSLDELERIIDEWSLSKDETFEAAQKASTQSIKVPVLDQNVSSKYTAIVLLLAIIPPLVFLISICKTLAIRITRKLENDEGAGFDWIFLHDSYIGPVLGSIWLLLPVAVAIVGIVRGTFTPPLSIGLLLICVLVSAYTIHCAWGLRRIWYSRNA